MKWVLGWPLSLFGLYCGNPGAPELPEKGLFLPVEIPVAVKIGYEGSLVFKTNGDFRYQMQQGVLTVDWVDRVDLFASFGQMQGKHHQGFTWGVGTEVLLLYWHHFVMGLNAKFQQASLGAWKYKEWQVAPAISFETEYVKPYVGVAYHALYLERGLIKEDPKDPFIFFFGMGLTPGKGMALNLEGRAIGETAFSLSINFRF